MSGFFRPNIDRNGRIARAASGALFLAAGVGVWLAGGPEVTPGRLAISLVAVFAGVFQLFEAWRAWCLLRACGVKTPL